MRDLTMWGLWYWLLVSLPLVGEGLLVKNLVVRAAANRRRFPTFNRKGEVRHVTVQDG
jgi:hypothetical protein